MHHADIARRLKAPKVLDYLKEESHLHRCRPCILEWELMPKLYTLGEIAADLRYFGTIGSAACAARSAAMASRSFVEIELPS